jgi:hypothetical protein
VICGILLVTVTGLAAEPEVPLAPASDAVWQVVVSPWTHHYQARPEYKQVWALGLEREMPDHSLYGLALFSNSYGQPSAYAYYGHVFNNVTSWSESIYVKLTVGVIYGYVQPYEDRMLLNYHGFSPAIIPGIGWRLDPDWSIQANFPGTEVVMFTLSRGL